MSSPNRRFKDAIYEQLARIGKATAAPKRLELLDLLCQGPRTVELLAREAGVTVANASQHLQVLRAARLVAAEKQGDAISMEEAVIALCERKLGEFLRDFLSKQPNVRSVPTITFAYR